MSTNSLLTEIDQELEKVRLIDAHTHIVPFGELKDTTDLFKLFALHSGSTLVSSGMREADYEQLLDNRIKAEDKWQLFAPYWRKIFNTAYAKLFMSAIAKLYEIDPQISENNYTNLSKLIEGSYSSHTKVDWYHHVLQETAGIEKAILDYGTTQVDRQYFVPVYRFENRRAPAYDHFITVRTLDELEMIGEHYNQCILTFDDFLVLYEKVFTQRVNDGIVGIKLLLGYLRTLDFSVVTKNDAERVFNTIFTRFKPNPGFLQHQLEGPSWEETKLLQDFMVHQTLRHASRNNLVVQIHAGFQLGKRNVIDFGDPKLLNNLFIHYPTVKFVIMHTAVPFSYDLACMAKNFNNVAIDFSWANTLSPSMAARFMSDVLEFLPIHKIIGYGSDNATVEGALGEAIACRKMMTNVLYEKVSSGYFTVEEAIATGKQILRENAITYFNLKS